MLVTLATIGLSLAGTQATNPAAPCEDTDRFQIVAQIRSEGAIDREIVALRQVLRSSPTQAAAAVQLRRFGLHAPSDTTQATDHLAAIVEQLDEIRTTVLDELACPTTWHWQHAVAKLGESPHRSFLPLLSAIAREPGPGNEVATREAAALAIARTPGPEAFEVLIDLLDVEEVQDSVKLYLFVLSDGYKPPAHELSGAYRAWLAANQEAWTDRSPDMRRSVHTYFGWYKRTPASSEPSIE